MTVTANSWNKQIRSAVASLSALAGVGLFAPPLASAQSTYQQLAVFPPAVGTGTSSTMAIDSNGDLFGVTPGNTIFQYSSTTHAITTYVNLNPNTWGSVNSVITDSHGNLLAASSTGVIEIAAGTKNPTQLATFDATYAQPQGRLAIDANGNICGTTSLGGANHAGCIYEVNGTTHALSQLYSFSGPDGQTPTAGVIADTKGNLYGTTAFGGAGGQGTVFKLNIATQQLTKLWDFTGGDGARPTGELVRDSHDNLYGNASVAGSHAGTIFKVLGGSVGNTGAIHDFTVIDGANPTGRLAIGPNGEVFGTTSFGGSKGHGIVFELIPSTQSPHKGPYAYTYTDLHDFGGPNDGALPAAGFVMDAAGNLYGATQGGDNGGVIFKLSAVPQPAAISRLNVSARPLIPER